MHRHPYTHYSFKPLDTSTPNWKWLYSCHHHMTHDSQFYPIKLAQMLASRKHCTCYTATDTAHSKYYQIKSNAEEHKAVFQELVICSDVELWSREFSRFRNEHTVHLSLSDLYKHSLQNKICHWYPSDVTLSPPSSLSSKASRLQIHHHLFGTSKPTMALQGYLFNNGIKMCTRVWIGDVPLTNRENITISNVWKLKFKKKELFCPDYLSHIHRVQL